LVLAAVFALWPWGHGTGPFGPAWSDFDLLFEWLAPDSASWSFKNAVLVGSVLAEKTTAMAIGTFVDIWEEMKIVGGEQDCSHASVPRRFPSRRYLVHLQPVQGALACGTPENR
jgi:hypothetical protein